MQKRRWTDDEVRVLREQYPHTRTADIAAALGRTVTQLYAKADQLGVKKTAEFLISENSGRLDGVRGSGTRFQKGITPWNKGTKGITGQHENCQRTQFKKGHFSGRAAEVYKPIGTERLSKDGYLERKIHDGMPLQSRWRAVHIVRWEEINGPLPKGHALVFRDSDKSNTDPSNMELVTRAELMRRNSYHTNYPKEIATVIQLRGAVVRQINRRAKREKQS